MHTKWCFCTFFVMSLRKDFFARINFREIAQNSRNLLPVKGTSYKIKWLKMVKLLKLYSCKFYNNKYMIASTQIKKTEIFPFIWYHILWHNSWLCWRLKLFLCVSCQYFRSFEKFKKPKSKLKYIFIFLAHS